MACLSVCVLGYKEERCSLLLGFGVRWILGYLFLQVSVSRWWIAPLWMDAKAGPYLLRLHTSGLDDGHYWGLPITSSVLLIRLDVALSGNSVDAMVP